MTQNPEAYEEKKTDNFNHINIKKKLFSKKQPSQNEQI